jgi:DNA-binding NtrC family response regulator
MTTVLFIDDDGHQSVLYKELLEDAGLQVRVAASADEGLAKISQSLPDIVVLDVVMPAKDGIECMGAILDRHNTLPVILHSGYSNYQSNFMTWCADAYVTKSSDAKELLQAIANLTSSEVSQAPIAGSRTRATPIIGGMNQYGKQIL